MKRKLTKKEKLFIFEMSDDTEQKIREPKYTSEFADDGITKAEFNAMANDKQLQYRLTRHLNRCGTQLRRIQGYWKLRRAFDEEVKKNILPRLYNNDEDIAEFYEPIRPIVVTLLDSFFRDEELTAGDFDNLWANVTDDTYLVAEAFEELVAGERDVRQCEGEECKKLFLPTPHGRDQKFCSAKCRRRNHYKKTGY